MTAPAGRRPAVRADLHRRGKKMASAEGAKDAKKMKRGHPRFHPGIFFASFAFFAVASRAADWPGWRGDGSGNSPEKNIPAEWSAAKNVRWSVPVPGFGWSSPVVAGDRIFLTTATSEKQTAPQAKGPGSGSPPPDEVFRREVHCLDRATGRTLWKQVAVEGKPATGNHPSNTWASETPVTDGESVFAYFGMAGVFCYDLAGKLAWSRDLGAYRTFANWGSSSSPALEGGRLFILCDNEEKSFLVALDKKTGQELWRIARGERSTWSTPVVWRNSQRTELVVMGGKRIRGYDPATGRELWSLATGENTASGGGGKKAAGGCKASPVAGGDLLYVGMSSKEHGQELGPMWAVRAGASGDISLRENETSNAGIAWFRKDAGPHFTSALVHDGRLTVFPPHDRGVLSCFDAKTGATLYTAALPGAAGFKASPVRADGKIFCTDERGVTFVIEDGATFKLLAKNPLDEMTWSSPALAGGALFLRSITRLFCVAAK